MAGVHERLIARARHSEADVSLTASCGRGAPSATRRGYSDVSCPNHQSYGPEVMGTLSPRSEFCVWKLSCLRRIIARMLQTWNA